MASRGHAALWVKLYELELQLRLMRAARGEDVMALDDDDGDAVSRAAGGGEGTCRGRQYDAYMRRRDARRHHAVAASLPAERPREEEGQMTPRPRAAAVAAGGRPSPLALSLGEAKRSPRRESGALLPRARTVNAVAASGGAARHQRRSSLGVVPSDYGESVTPRPFLKRGSGTGGATTTTTTTPRLRVPPPPATARVHDIPHTDAITMASPRQPHLAQSAAARRRHTRSVSELPLPLHHHTAAAIELPSPSPSPSPRARKQWGSPETTPRAMLFSSSSSGESHRDFAKGLKKLLSFVRKSSRSSKSGGEQQQHSPARRPAARKPVMMSTGWHAAAAAPAVTA